MGEPFSSAPENRPAGRVRKTEAKTKWQAAKSAVLDEIKSLNGDEQVCLIAFNSQPSIAFEGAAAEADRLQSILEGLSPSGDTDMAAALGAANDFVRRCDVAPHTTNVELVSDGLSPLEPARAAAQALCERVGTIEVILIDPTSEGQAVARAIAVRGRVTSVTSAAELHERAADAAEHHAAEVQRVSAVLTKAAAERSASIGSVPSRERLSLTAAYPGAPLPEIWYTLTIYLHLQANEEQVRRRISEQQRRVGHGFDTTSKQLSVLRGTWLTVTPRVDGVTFNPRSHEIAWYEDIQEVPFRFRAIRDFAGTSTLGAVDVYADGGFLVGQLPISLHVRGPSDTISRAEDDEAAAWTSDGTHMFEAVFASYAHQDQAVVDRCAAAYKALGIHLYIDHESLRAGEAWHPALLDMIGRSDVFQLYWSEAASRSRYVAEEWRHALTQRDLKGDRFIRGLYWTKPMPKAPVELEATHFGFLDLTATPLAQAPSGDEPVGAPAVGVKSNGRGNGSEMVDPLSSSPEAERFRARSIQTAVVPLLAGESRKSVAARRADVASAVAFLESITGLHYYAVPTVLVDDLVVRQVRRAREVVDETPPTAADPQAMVEVEVWRNVLQSLLLEFHKSYVPPLAFAQHTPRQDLDEALRALYLKEGVSLDARKALKEFAEWGVTRWTRHFLFYPWDERSKFFQADNLSVPPLTVSLSERVLATLDKILLATRGAKLASSRQSLALSFSRPTSSDPAEFDDRLAWRAIRTEPFLQDSHSVEREDDWGINVEVSLSTLVRTLEQIRAELARILPPYDTCSYVSAKAPDASAMRCIGLATCAEKIIAKLCSKLPENDRTPGDHVGDWVVEIVHPSWRRARDLLRDRGIKSMRSELDFHSFLTAYLQLMEVVFRYGDQATPGFMYEGRYSINENSWQAIKRECGHVGLTARAQPGGRQPERTTFVLEGPFAAYLRLFLEAGPRLLAALRAAAPRSNPRLQLVNEVIEASAYGIFVPEAATAVDAGVNEWAVRNGLAPHATLPGTARVLFRSRGSSELGGVAMPEAQLHVLERCTLVHEHFHAILETGIGGDSLPARGAGDPSAWERAAPLNEALAAWMELQYVRRYAPWLGTPDESSALQTALWAYIRSGQYPEWPYHGAERIELLFERGGIDAVRNLVLSLRDDPLLALQTFEGIE